MDVINITNIIVKNNPAPFAAPLQFEIYFICTKPYAGEVEWRMVYLGHSLDKEYDQLLGSVTLGPFEEVGVEMQFDWEVNPPDPAKLPKRSDFLDNGGLVISVHAEGKEITRVGYLVNHSYDDPELNEDQSEIIRLDRVIRDISKPLVNKKTVLQEEFEKAMVIETAQNTNGGNGETFNAGGVGDISREQNFHGQQMIEEKNPFLQ
eukprot:TRINITY_DN3241_c0_g1_i4.p1 TRINITY_DN3241_c0_g1~~TRINITY_DN3241_c0_g1_i4.p1  ORF type:complete len:206 (+),score=66.21 TRINITY_DN3241_c0_g1_i4:66-683(+)